MSHTLPPLFRRVTRCAVSLSVLSLATLTAHAAGPAQTELVARGLENPWAVAFLGEGRFLVTERPGRMRVVQADGRVGPALGGLPPVQAGGQGGLLDVIADRDFPRNRRVHWCYSEPGEGGNSTALASGTLNADATALQDVKVVFSQRPKVQSRLHFGCRIVQTDDGGFFLTLGDRYHRMADAQTLDNHHGKVVRLKADGSAHPGNPYLGQSGALPEIYSLGHRNPQGAALGPDGRLWLVEHGPQGGDELNRPDPGANHGWPVVTFGENYGGGRIGEGLTSKPGMVAPLWQWTPSMAPSGMAWVRSERYPGWKGSLLVGSLKFRYVARLQLDGTRVVKEEKLLPDVGRVRDVREGPDGWIYLLTDERDGRLLRVKPGA
jgi:glucose/arabinose dehydrogenase